MLRLLLSLGFACFLVLAGQAGTFVEEVCEQGCPDDDADGNCAATCADCACCSHLSQTAPLLNAAAAIGLSLVQVDVEWTGRALPLVDPQEILHVPKTVLA